MTTNLNGHWQEFYDVFEQTVLQAGKTKLVEKIKKDSEHRGTVDSVSKLFTDNGLEVKRSYQERFEMKFLDGKAFLNHHFVKLGWLTSWMDLMPETDLATVFELLETNLNSYAVKNGGLLLTVPMAYIEGEKTNR